MEAHTGLCSDGHGMEQRQRSCGLGEVDCVQRRSQTSPQTSDAKSIACGGCRQARDADTRRQRGGQRSVRGLGVGAGRAWRGSIMLVLGALLIATDVAGQNPRLLENNGGHFRFGNIRW